MVVSRRAIWEAYIHVHHSMATPDLPLKTCSVNDEDHPLNLYYIIFHNLLHVFNIKVEDILI